MADAPPPVCDFCLRAGPEWEYPAAPMPLPTHPVLEASMDEFGACEDCRRLIDAADVDGLVHRIVTMQPVHVPQGTIAPEGGIVVYPPIPTARANARLTVELFFTKLGPARRYVTS